MYVVSYVVSCTCTKTISLYNFVFAKLLYDMWLNIAYSGNSLITTLYN